MRSHRNAYGETNADYPIRNPYVENRNDNPYEYTHFYSDYDSLPNCNGDKYSHIYPYLYTNTECNKHARSYLCQSISR